MKLLRPLGIAFVLLLLLVATAAGQSDEKRAKLIPDTEAPWGLVIQFAEQTTVAQEKALREKYGLTVTPSGYHYADPSPYLGQTFDEDLYSGKEEYRYQAIVDHYGNEQLAACLTAGNCPPLFVESVWYEPVDTATEQALLAEAQIAKLDNRRTTTFFFLKLIECWIEQQIHAQHQCTVITPWA